MTKLATEKFDEFTVTEMTLGQMRELQKEHPDMEREDAQYLIACKCVTKADGKCITMDELLGVGMRRATKLLQVVSRLNGADGSADEKGNG